MAGEDSAYTALIRALSCCADRSCRSQSEVHHRTGAGMAMRSHDHESMPLCHDHHMQFHDAGGMFKGWSKAKRKRWQQEQVAICQADLLQLEQVAKPSLTKSYSSSDNAGKATVMVKPTALGCVICFEYYRPRTGSHLEKRCELGDVNGSRTRGVTRVAEESRDLGLSKSMLDDLWEKVG